MGNGREGVVKELASDGTSTMGDIQNGDETVEEPGDLPCGTGVSEMDVSEALEEQSASGSMDLSKLRYAAIDDPRWPYLLVCQKDAWWVVPQTIRACCGV